MLAFISPPFYSVHDLGNTLRLFMELNPRYIEDLQLWNSQFCPILQLACLKMTKDEGGGVWTKILVFINIFKKIKVKAVTDDGDDYKRQGRAISRGWGAAGKDQRVAKVNAR